MARKRITFIQDESKMAVHSTAIEDALRHWKDVEQDSIEVERLPDPPIKQRFIVEVESPASTPGAPLSADVIRRCLQDYQTCLVPSRLATVTEAPVA